MYNAQKPDLNDLPSSARLLKSSIIAALAAVAILITIVLPAEYGIDPTGAGHVLGLTHMGEIKSQLHEEAEADHQSKMDDEGRSGFVDGLLGFFVANAHAQDVAEPWIEEVSFTLAPGEAAEFKLVMEENAEIEYLWVAVGGRLNFDLHGDGEAQEVSYEKGRGSPGGEGILKVQFAGNHGWFWRNRDKTEVSVTLSVRGDFLELKRTY